MQSKGQMTNEIKRIYLCHGQMSCNNETHEAGPFCYGSKLKYIEVASLVKYLESDEVYKLGLQAVTQIISLIKGQDHE